MKLEQTEHELQAAILDYLNLHGHYCWRNNSGAFQIKDRFIRAGKKGSADIIGVEKNTGRFIAIEVKGKKGKLSLEQEEFLKEVSDRGGIAITAYNLDDVIKEL